MEGEVDEGAIGAALNFEISEQHVGTEQSQDFVDDIVLVCSEKSFRMADHLLCVIIVKFSPAGQEGAGPRRSVFRGMTPQVQAS